MWSMLDLDTEARQTMSASKRGWIAMYQQSWCPTSAASQTGHLLVNSELWAVEYCIVDDYQPQIYVTAKRQAAVFGTVTGAEPDADFVTADKSAWSSAKGY